MKSKQLSKQRARGIPLPLILTVLLVFAYAASFRTFSKDRVLLETASTQAKAALRHRLVPTHNNNEPAPSRQPLVISLQQHKYSLHSVGNKETKTGWYVDTMCFQDKPSILVYSVGVGTDIAWEVGMVEEFGATVHLFDPTEESLRYTAPILAKYEMEEEPRLTHTAEGLSNQKGSLPFALSADTYQASARRAELVDTIMNMTQPVTFPVNTLQNWMKDRQHTHLDVFKIVIGGSADLVLESLAADNILPFTQLLIEYQENCLENKSCYTKVMQALKEAGFVELWSNQGGQKVAYLKLADSPYCADGTLPHSASLSDSEDWN